MEQIADSNPDSDEAGEIWAIVLSNDGHYLASTSINGCINVWDRFVEQTKIHEFATDGQFGMAIDMVCLLCFQVSFSFDLSLA